MYDFSAEDRFVADNMKTVLEVIKAKDRLQEKIDTILFSLVERLQYESWWSGDWEMRVVRNKSDFYFAHSSWMKNGEALIWIGVNRLSVEALFGTEEHSDLYLWVYEKIDPTTEELKKARRANLKQLVQENPQKDDDLIDRVSTDGWYFVYRKMVKRDFSKETSLPDYIGGYIDEIVSFISHYAPLLESYCRSTLF